MEINSNIVKATLILEDTKLENGFDNKTSDKDTHVYGGVVRSAFDWKKERDMFNQMADYYDRYRPGYPNDIIKTIIERAGLIAGSKLLEIGAGSGLFMAPEIIHSKWEKIYTVDDYFGYMLTGNVFIQKSDTEKQMCFDELKRLADKHDGKIKREYTCELYLARKK